MRRGLPELVVGLLFAILLSSYVVFTRQVVRDLKGEGKRTSEMYARVFRAQSDTTESASTQALFDLSRSIREQGVPLIVTDRAGKPGPNANLPEGVADDEARLLAYVRELGEVVHAVAASLRRRDCTMSVPIDLGSNWDNCSSLSARCSLLTRQLSVWATPRCQSIQSLCGLLGLRLSR